eukprot:Protomagalhaensia_wolfi_Nauph_80__3635@NODE_366_length_2667_cov_20_190639_g276_i0_p2_GENE_NODE_366_length_2667_cov_20_190639_g276_i0NODE_366_length_2667_cov_20_190639_g276_i0_p2_ORF_typecomplete_len169_score20_92_NODE_366_length_2667_cov_20_190639_g276_i093599
MLPEQPSQTQRRTARNRFSALAQAAKYKSRSRTTSIGRTFAGDTGPDEHPPGLPSCIPAEAAEAFFNASPEIQRQMLRDASEPSRVYKGNKPILRSERRFRAEGTVCFCQDMRYCPLVAITRPNENPRFTGDSYQFYPTDQGWWKMRDTVLRLGKMAGREVETEGVAL